VRGEQMTFSHDGVWWDPSDPKTQRVGTLQFDVDEGATLRLILPAEKLDLFPELGSHALFLGLTTEGTPVTLVHCIGRSTRGTSGRAPMPFGALC
jgi:ApeA N-terminal domain 1